MAYEPLDAPTDAVSAEVARDFAARYLEALNAHDVERVVSLTTEDVFWEDPYVRGGSFRGHNELRAFFAYLWRAFPDLEVRLVDDVYVSSDGMKAAAPLRFGGVMKGRLDPPGFAPTQTRGEVVIAVFWEFRDGKLCHLRAVTDLNDFARQIGAVPPPGSLGERLAVQLQRIAARRFRRRAAQEPTKT